jgi:hypothetical protein
MYQEEFVEASPSGPRPFGEMPSLWLKVLEMDEAFFAQEAPRASGTNTLISVLIITGVAIIAAVISTLIGSSLQAAFLPPEYRESALVGAGAGVTGALCGGLFGGLIGFYLGNGFIYLVARILGGSGDYGTHTYLVSLFIVPIGIVTGALSIIPCVGPLVALVISIYGIVLNVRAVKVTHNLTTGKSVVAVLSPAILGILLACIVILMLTLIGGAVGGVFEELMYELQ